MNLKIKFMQGDLISLSGKRIAATAFALTFSLFTTAGLQSASAGKPIYGAATAVSVGTGGTSSAFVDDPSALLLNPAGLAHINGEAHDKAATTAEGEAALSDENIKKMFEEISGEVQDEVKPPRSFEMQIFSSYGMETLDRTSMFAGVGFTALGGTIGLGAYQSGVTGIDGYDAAGVSTGSLEYVYRRGVLGYAFEAGASRLGVTLSGTQEDLGGSSLYGGSMNLGWQMSPIPIVETGLNIVNLAGVAQNSQGNYEKLDTVVDFALALSPPPPRSTFKLVFGLRTNLDETGNQKTEKNIGVRFRMTENMLFMGGMQNGNVAAGAGIEFKRLHLNYAINQDKLRTGIQQYIDLNLIF